MFPEGFVWGAATASYQIEGAVDDGGRAPSVWDTFAHTEGKVANGETGDVACDHYHRVEEDVALMAELGLQTYRFSIAWSRVMPGGRGPVNADGLGFYHRLVDLLLDHGIAPCPTLFHWDLPQELEDLGGFRSRDTVSWFADYAALMVGELGDRVSMWSTFNEPWCFAYLGHAAGYHAPGLTDPGAAVTVAHHELLAHGLAVRAMRTERDGLQLGIVINPSNVRREGEPPAPEDQMRLIDAIHNRWWFDGLLRGEYPADLLASYGELAGAVQAGDLAIIAEPLDWIGINYYFDILVRGLAADDPSRRMRAYPTVNGVTEADRREAHTDMGWPITPEGFTELLRAPAQRLPQPAAAVHHRERLRLRRPGDRRSVCRPPPHRVPRSPSAGPQGRHGRWGRCPGVLPVVADGQLRVGVRLRQALRPGPCRLRLVAADASRQCDLVPRRHRPQRPRRH